jgi:hypothetical protein
MTEASPTPASAGRELLIEHTYAEGTLLTGTRHEDDRYTRCAPRLALSPLCRGLPAAGQAGPAGQPGRDHPHR